MFSGIVQNRASVTIEARLPQLWTLSVPLSAKQRESLAVGASIALNGACLTVTRQENDLLFFDAMQETLGLTTLGALKTGNRINFERAARIGDEIGGHLLSGHIHTAANIVAIDRPENNCTLTFEVPSQWARYIFPKGYIAINGASLTIGDVTENRFNIHLIPETLRATTFADVTVGDRVNIEIDSQTQTIVDSLDTILPRLGYARPDA
jgi:riboflavin synthase